MNETLLLIVWHSRTGASEQLAIAAERAALEQCPTAGAVRRLYCEDATPEDLLAARGYLFICPENLAAIAGLMKEFFDRSYYPLLGQIEARPYASMISAGSDGQNASRQLARIATGWRLKAVQASLIINTAAQTPEEILAPKKLVAEQLNQAAELGAALAAGIEMGIY